VDRHGGHCRGDGTLARAAPANCTLCFDTGGDLSHCAGLEIHLAKAQGATPRALGYSIRCENAAGLYHLAIAAKDHRPRRLVDYRYYL
jgi:hypothetical protein